MKGWHFPKGEIHAAGCALDPGHVGPCYASPRKKHDDTGPALSKADLELQKACLDVEAHVSAAVVRLRNLAKKRLDAGTRLEVDRHLSALSVWLKNFGDQRKAAGL